MHLRYTHVYTLGRSEEDAGITLACDTRVVTTETQVGRSVLLDRWIPLVGLLLGLTWFVWGFVPPSVIPAPDWFIEYELFWIPALLGVLALLSFAGLVKSKGRSVLAWAATIVLGMQVVAGAFLLFVLWSIRDF